MEKICKIQLFHGRMSSGQAAGPHISEDGRSRIEDVLATSPRIWPWDMSQDSTELSVIPDYYPIL